MKMKEVGGTNTMRIEKTLEGQERVDFSSSSSFLGIYLLLGNK